MDILFPEQSEIEPYQPLIVEMSEIEARSLGAVGRPGIEIAVGEEKAQHAEGAAAFYILAVAGGQHAGLRTNPNDDPGVGKDGLDPPGELGRHHAMQPAGQVAPGKSFIADQRRQPGGCFGNEATCPIASKLRPFGASNASRTVLASMKR